MRIIILICLFLAFNSQVLSQNVLQLENSVSGKKRIIKQGSKFHFKSTYDSSYVKGKLAQVKDTSIVIFLPENDGEMSLLDLRLTDITEIKKPTKFHAISRTVGSVLLPVGTFLTINGLITLSRDPKYQGVRTYDRDITAARTAVGGVFIVAGVIPFIVKPKIYNLRKGWTLSVKKDLN